MKAGTVLFISDIHTHYRVINEQIAHAEQGNVTVEKVIVLGDFGFFGSHLHDFFRNLGQRFTRPVASIDGNHEDHGALIKLAEQYDDVLQYLPRGSIISLPAMNGLCLGGARYMDAVSTPRGSEISTADLEACLVHEPQEVDLILTHDCPVGIGVKGTPGMEYYGEPGVPQMKKLGDYFKPGLWIFGHHHRWFDKIHEGTRYIGLPESWVGYALMDADGQVERIEHSIAHENQPWWKMG